MPTATNPLGPLHGLRVLDCSRLLPGPACSQLLVDLGATVLRVDHPDPRRGDLVRSMYPRLPEPGEDAPNAGSDAASLPTPSASGDNRAYAFIGLNHGKHSVRLDLTDPAGQERFLALVAGADVVLESFRPGVLDKHGCGWEAIHTTNPRAILCSITGFGQTGPDARRAGHDIGYLSRAGILGVSGDAGSPPLPLGAQVADLAGGALPGVIGILAALRERDGAPGAPGSGLGQHVDVSMTDASRALLALEGTTALAGHELPPRGTGPLSGAAVACYRTYACADGHVTLGALEPKFWKAWCEGIDRPDLLAAQGAAPGTDQATEIEAIFAARTREEWTAFGRQHDCCLEPVLTPAEAFADAGDRSTVTATGPEGQPVAVPHPGIQFSRSPVGAARPAPASGADDAVLASDDPWAAL